MQTSQEIIYDFFNQHVPADADMGIFCSGGFDSTTLAYCVFEFAQQRTNRSVQIFTVPRHDDSLAHSARVIDWISQCFPQVIVEHHTVGDPDLHHSMQVRSGIIQALDQHPQTYLILGDTGIPEALLSNAPERQISNHPRVLQPFIHHDKTATIMLARELNILDSVSQLSHSCTQSTGLRCSQCWQCCERAWAFSKLGLIDRGTM